MLTGTLKLPSPVFTQDELHALAEAAMKTEQERISKGVDIHDQPAKPLTQPYERRKERAGKKGIRDMHNTGKLLASRDVVSVDGQGIEVGFTLTQEELIARINNTRDPMFGLSPDNIDDVNSEASRIFAGKFQH
jgi:hypothetical protein